MRDFLSGYQKGGDDWVGEEAVAQPVEAVAAYRRCIVSSRSRDGSHICRFF